MQSTLYGKGTINLLNGKFLGAEGGIKNEYGLTMPVNNTNSKDVKVEGNGAITFTPKQGVVGTIKTSLTVQNEVDENAPPPPGKETQLTKDLKESSSAVSAEEEQETREPNTFNISSTTTISTTDGKTKVTNEIDKKKQPDEEKKKLNNNNNKPGGN